MFCGIQIIAILAGLLLPSLNQAREKARSIACVNNQRQVSSVLIHYSLDFNDYLLPANSNKAASGWNAARIWCYFLVPKNLGGYTGNAGYEIFNTNLLWSKSKRQPWHCPTEEAWGQVSGGTVFTDFGLNSNTTGYGISLDWKKTSWIKTPSRRVWLGDTNPNTGYFGITASHFNSNQTLSPRHNKNVNFVMHDGHSERFNLYKLPVKAGYTGQNPFKEQGTGATEVAYPY